MNDILGINTSPIKFVSPVELPVMYNQYFNQLLLVDFFQLEVHDQVCEKLCASS